MKINFTPKKMFYAAVTTVALAGSALVGGGAAIRYQNEPHDSVQIDLTEFKNELEKVARHLTGNYTKKDLAEKHVDDLESTVYGLYQLENDNNNFENYLRNQRDEAVERQKESDLKKADNALKRTAIKAYAMARLGANRVSDAIEDIK